ncbi:MAG: hypothetical protein HGB32_05185 [Geobacteraceae bacterium]|nr:hypothetical protein [Geobacteraceae bacterium]NTW79524.1 hypothetical protein [Geobacteraceae bacterium]
MVTFFSIPKAFEAHNGFIQRNAIASWLQLQPVCEIILFGNDPGVAQAAAEFGVIHIPDVETNEFGTPLLNSAFKVAQDIAKHDILVYVNADIIIHPGFLEAIQSFNFKPFLLSGRRWDLDVRNKINYSDLDWHKKLNERTLLEGVLHGSSGMDYFVFPRHTIDMPRFAVGRPGWDAWLIWKSKSTHIPVIDGTERIIIVHQNHDYGHSKFGEKKRVSGPEMEMNLSVAGGLSCMMTLREADWLLGKDGLKRPKFPRRFFPLLAKSSIWRFLITMKRKFEEWRLRSWRQLA